MWCVMQVPTGREQELQKKCEEKLDSSVLEKSFLPYYDEMRKVGGVWTTSGRSFSWLCVHDHGAA